MGRTLHFIIRLFAVLAGLLLILMVGVMTASIVLRQFGVLLVGTEDIVTFAMAGLAFLALPYVYVTGKHIRVETVYTRLPEGAQRHINVFCIALGVIVSLALAYFTAKLTWGSYRFGDTSFGLLSIPLWIPQFPMFLGLTVMALALFQDLIAILRGGPASFQLNREEHDAAVTQQGSN